MLVVALTWTFTGPDDGDLRGSNNGRLRDTHASCVFCWCRSITNVHSCRFPGLLDSAHDIDMVKSVTLHKLRFHLAVSGLICQHSEPIRLTFVQFCIQVNCRRAAAAAFQEAVGRQGNFAHGIDIVQRADYFSLGTRAHAYKHVAPFVAQFEEYRQPLIHHIMETKISHWVSNWALVERHEELGGELG
jgi:hypothetical protein